MTCPFFVLPFPGTQWLEKLKSQEPHLRVFWSKQKIWLHLWSMKGIFFSLSLSFTFWFLFKLSFTQSIFTVKTSSSPLIQDQKTLHCSISSGVNGSSGFDFRYLAVTDVFLNKISRHFSVYNDFLYTLTTFLILWYFFKCGYIFYEDLIPVSQWSLNSQWYCESSLI